MATAEQVLMVVTSHDRIDEEHHTGLWLEEFAVPYLLFRKEGLPVTVASPLGGTVPVDPRSLPDAARAREWAEPLERLKSTLCLEDMAAENFAAAFLPGGHGTMFDLPHNRPLTRLLTGIAAADKIIAAVCHGPAGLVNVQMNGGLALVTDRTVTAFTNEEEAAVGLDRLMPFLLESKLRELGAHFIAAPPWSEHVEVDGNLITGQNPQSSAAAARALIEALGG
jgi:putative intracellular protease/amidase